MIADACGHGEGDMQGMPEHVREEGPLAGGLRGSGLQADGQAQAQPDVEEKES